MSLEQMLLVIFLVRKTSLERLVLVESYVFALLYDENEAGCDNESKTVVSNTLVFLVFTQTNEGDNNGDRNNIEI